MQSVREWLNGARDYATGVALYLAHGSNAALKDALQQGESDYRKERLIKELTALLDASGPDAVPLPTPEPMRVIATAAAVVLPEQAVPEGKDPYRAEWLPLYAEMNALRHRLEDAPDDAERGKMAFRILDLERQCMSIWDRRDYWRRTGQHVQVEQAAPEQVTDPNMLHRRLMNARASVSKWKKKAAAEPHRADWQEKLRRLQEEVIYLEKELSK